MMKFIKVLEGKICADSAAKSEKLIKIPEIFLSLKAHKPC